nr:hypothetical protein [Bdellovibrionales bacterium]
MAMLNFARIGAVLSYYGDGDGDGAADGGYDPCLRANSARPATAGAGDFLPADLRELGAGLTNALANLAAVSSRVDLGSGSLDSVAGACTSLAGVDPAYDFCAILDPADFTADHLRALATLINESTAVGLGTCTGNAVACLCGP